MNLAQATGLALMVLAAASHPAPAANPAASARGAAAAATAPTPAGRDFDRAARAFGRAVHDGLTAAGTQLGVLARSVERGAAKGAKALDEAFDNARHTLQKSIRTAQRT